MKKNILLFGLVIILALAPFFVAKKGEFAGADSRASDAISELNPNYKPWFKPIWTPPSGEVETFFFAAQAALGAAVVAYYIGLSKGRSERL